LFGTVPVNESLGTQSKEVVSVEVAELRDDLLTGAATDDPHPLFAELREADPVHWSERHQAWLVTRYDDVSAAFRNRALSSDRIRPMLAGRKPDEVRPADEILRMMSRWMVTSDPPDHTRLRRLAAGAFKGQRIATMESRIAALVDGFLDDFVAGGHTDLIEHVAFPLPATVIAELLGAPAQDRDRFRHWSDELALVAFGAGGEAREERHARALVGLREMSAYFAELAARRRAAPADDMLSALLEGDGEGGHLGEDELVGMCALLLFAGHETTTNSVANGLLTLLRNPDQLARLRADPALMPAAVEELLRIEGPIKLLVRWVAEDHEFGGSRLRAGERCYLVLSSANRDPEKFAEPDRLDLERRPNPHVAFGKGIHACIGAQLARLETRVTLTRILERLPGLRLAGDDLHWHSSLASRSLHALPVTHDALPR
jgi:cytochrome P450